MDAITDIKDIHIITEEIERFRLLVHQKYDVKKIILYGSYAKGHPSKDSDIDIGVVIDAPIEADKIDITATLFHFSRQIDTAMEPFCILWNEYKNCEKGTILSEIITTGIEIV
jgi:predicted nucleotidyltransferase